MLRQKVGEGDRQRYERVLPSHSWNSNNIATNVLLYHLQRHSDHHANPTRRYQTLRDFEESPTLPTGYAGMIVLAIVPAVWRRVMDQRVVDHFGGDVSLANISPRKRRGLPASATPPGSRARLPPSDAEPRGAADRGGRGAGRAVPGLRVRLRGGRRRRARGLRRRHRLGRHPGRLVLPRLRGAREGRLRALRARARRWPDGASAHDLAPVVGQAAGAPGAVEVVEQRQHDPARGAEPLARGAGGEGLVEPGAGRRRPRRSAPGSSTMPGRDPRHSSPARSAAPRRALVEAEVAQPVGGRRGEGRGRRGRAARRRRAADTAAGGPSPAARPPSVHDHAAAAAPAARPGPASGSRSRAASTVSGTSGSSGWARACSSTRAGSRCGEGDGATAGVDQPGPASRWSPSARRARRAGAAGRRGRCRGGRARRRGAGCRRRRASCAARRRRGTASAQPRAGRGRARRRATAGGGPGRAAARGRRCAAAAAASRRQPGERPSPSGRNRTGDVGRPDVQHAARSAARPARTSARRPRRCGATPPG